MRMKMQQIEPAEREQAKLNPSTARNNNEHATSSSSGSTTSLLFWLHKSRFLKLKLEASNLAKPVSFVVDPLQISFDGLCKLASRGLNENGPFLFVYKSVPLSTTTTTSTAGSDALSKTSSFVPAVISDDFDLDALLQHCIRTDSQRITLTVLPTKLLTNTSAASSIVGQQKQQQLASSAATITRIRVSHGDIVNSPSSSPTVDEKNISFDDSAEWELVEHASPAAVIIADDAETDENAEPLTLGHKKSSSYLKSHSSPTPSEPATSLKTPTARTKERLTIQLPAHAPATSGGKLYATKHSTSPLLPKRQTQQLRSVSTAQSRAAVQSPAFGHPLFSCLDHRKHAGQHSTTALLDFSTQTQRQQHDADSVHPLTAEEYCQYFDNAGTLASPLELRHAIFMRGTAPEVRRSAWRHLLNVYPLCDNFNEAARHKFLKVKCDQYFRLRNAWRTSSRVDNLSVRSVLQQIIRDVTRTDQDHEFFYSSYRSTSNNYAASSNNNNSNNNPRCFYNMNEVLLFHYFFSSNNASPMTGEIATAASERQRDSATRKRSATTAAATAAASSSTTNKIGSGGTNSTVMNTAEPTVDFLQWLAPTAAANRRAEQHLRSLFHILGTYALCHPSKVTYCQGMSDLAAALLYVYNGNEPLTYICFCALMQRRWRDFTEAGLAQEVKFNHLRRLLLYFDPELYKALLSLRDSDSVGFIFTYRWLLLEFKREFSFNDSLGVLEIILASLAPQANGPDGVVLCEPGTWVEQEANITTTCTKKISSNKTNSNRPNSVHDAAAGGTLVEMKLLNVASGGGGEGGTGGVKRIESYEEFCATGDIGFVREIYRRRQRQQHSSGNSNKSATTTSTTAAATISQPAAAVSTNAAAVDELLLILANSAKPIQQQQPQCEPPISHTDADTTDGMVAAPTSSVVFSLSAAQSPCPSPSLLATTSAAAAAAAAAAGAGGESGGDMSECSSRASMVLLPPRSATAATTEDSSHNTSGSNSSAAINAEVIQLPNAAEPPKLSRLNADTNMLLHEAAADDDIVSSSSDKLMSAGVLRELLPKPEDLGGGNPFLLLLALAVIMSHKNELLRCTSSYEVAMYFGELSRHHPTKHVQYYLNAARKLFAFYLRVFALKELEKSSSTLSLW